MLVLPVYKQLSRSNSLRSEPPGANEFCGCDAPLILHLISAQQFSFRIRLLLLIASCNICTTGSAAASAISCGLSCSHSFANRLRVENGNAPLSPCFCIRRFTSRIAACRARMTTADWRNRMGSASTGHLYCLPAGLLELEQVERNARRLDLLADLIRSHRLQPSNNRTSRPTLFGHYLLMSICSVRILLAFVHRARAVSAPPPPPKFVRPLAAVVLREFCRN